MCTLGLVLLMLTNALQAQKSKSSEYQANWESLMKHQTPEWFMDAKFGIFIHWGVYSVPAYHPQRGYAEHYASAMYRKPAQIKYHTETYGKPGEYGYKDFIPDFKAEQFDGASYGLIYSKKQERSWSFL